MATDSPIDFEELLHDAVREILRDEDPAALRAWLERNLADYLDPDLRDEMPRDMHPMLAATLARAIWNVTPLPGNRFRPAPLPAPGRNDPCPCGSGRKYKRCCASAPDFPHLDVELMWGFVLDQLPDDRLARGIADKQLPIPGLVQYAFGLLEEGDPRGAAEVLAPVFDGQPLAALKAEAYEHALDLLSNAYDELGEEPHKLALLERVTREAARSPLRAGAWQRLAAVRIDGGDPAGAWEAFRLAQRDQPDAPPLAHLEILLLSEEGRLAEIPDRARHWVRRLRRAGFDDGDVVIDWLQAAARDPENALADLAIRASGDEGALLRGWIAAVRDRALPHYALADDDGPTPDGEETDGDEMDDEALAARLRAMGVPRDQIPALTRKFRADREAMADDGDDADDGDEDGEDGFDPEDSAVLTTPAPLRAIERDWHEVFEVDKPFSVNDEPMASMDPWEYEDAWCAFLSEHPQAFDSLDILDDLATAVMGHEQHGDEGFDREMLLPLLERAHAIVACAVEDAERPHLAWVIPDNRPALRAMVRLAMWRLRTGDEDGALALSQEVLALNPGDNHGLRAFVMERWLIAGRDEEALALAARFPDDLMAEIAYGRALALFRLGQTAAADEALRTAVDALPKVRDYLVRKRVREPAPGDGPGMIVGGDEQAWQYREIMRPVWAATAGALDWVEKTVPRKRRR